MICLLTADLGPSTPLLLSVLAQGESKRTIDYIFFTPASLRPVNRWRMLSEDEIGPLGLPSAGYASDHVAVFATFEWDPVHVAAPQVWLSDSRFGDWAVESEDTCHTNDWGA